MLYELLLNMLYELLLKSEKDLNSTVEKCACDSSEYYWVNNGELAVLLSKVSEPILAEVLQKKPKKAIALDKLFAGNDQLKTNTVLQMKDAKVEFHTIEGFGTNYE